MSGEDPLKELNKHLDENIPQEVLNADDWTSRFLMDLSEPIDLDEFSYDDMIEDEFDF